jgi:glycine oxidase
VRVIVIGAGVIGAAIAEELAFRGARVTAIDMRSPGRGASQASAGLLAPYNEAQGHQALLDLCTASLDLYDDFVSRARERSGVPIEYAREGTLEVALTEEEAGRLAQMRDWLLGRGVACEWLEAARLREFEPALTASAVGGLLIPVHGFVGARSLVKALVQSARLHGAEFENPVEAIRVDPLGDEVEVRSDARRLLADAVVVAAGSWSSRVRVAGQAALPIRPIRGQLLQLTWAEGPLPKRPVWGSRVYTVPWPPDTLLVGATVEDVGFDERSTVAGIRDLLAGVGELLPGAWQSSLAEVRVGLRPATEDGLPLIGPLAAGSRIHLATGHYRNGVLLAPLTAKKIADQIMAGGS